VQYTNNPDMAALPANADTEPFILVKLSSGKYAIAGAADIPLGATMRRVKANEAVSPRRPSAGSLVCTASAAIVAGAKVVLDANGKVKTLPTSGGGTAVQVGVAVTAAGADGDWLTVEPQRFGSILTVAP